MFMEDFVEKSALNFQYAFFHGGPSGTQPPLASYLLDDPMALPFGTRLRNFSAADNSPDCLLFAENPLRVRVPPIIAPNKKAPFWVLLFGGPSGTRTPDRPVMSRLL